MVHKSLNLKLYIIHNRPYAMKMRYWTISERKYVKKLGQRQKKVEEKKCW